MVDTDLTSQDNAFLVIRAACTCTCTVSRASAAQIRHSYVTSLTSSGGSPREATTDRPGSKRRISLYPFK